MYKSRHFVRSVLAISRGFNASRTSALVSARPVSVVSARLFGTSRVAHDKQKQELKEIFSTELQFEKKEQTGLEKFHEEWLACSGFKIVEADPTKVAAELVKETDTEVIHVYFNPLEVTNVPLETELFKQAPPEGEEDAEADEYDADEESSAEVDGMLDETISSVAVLIEKKGSSEGLYFNLLLSVHSNYFAIGGLKKFDDIKSAMKESAEDEFQRDSEYFGPPFTNLDEYLQEGLMEYLNSRGIDKSLGDFIVGYSLVKENDLYIAWLKDLKEYF